MHASSVLHLSELTPVQSMQCAQLRSIMRTKVCAITLGSTETDCIVADTLCCDTSVCNNTKQHRTELHSS
jgi:hypothetical protein